jgi:hypothetical protein
MYINWESLANETVGTMGDQNCLDGAALSARALEVILGEDFFRDAVEVVLKEGEESELARCILKTIRSTIAMKYCYEIFKTSDDVDRSISALALIRWIANSGVIQWIPELLSSSEPDVQNCAVAIIDQMLWSHILDYDNLKPMLVSSLSHPREYVRERIKLLIEQEENAREP